MTFGLKAEACTSTPTCRLMFSPLPPLNDTKLELLVASSCYALVPIYP